MNRANTLNTVIGAANLPTEMYFNCGKMNHGKMRWTETLTASSLILNTLHNSSI